MGAAGGVPPAPIPDPTGHATQDQPPGGDEDPGGRHSIPAVAQAAQFPSRPDTRYSAPPGDSDPTAPTLAGLTDLVPVGRGGDSTVYRAHQSSPDRDVAVKVLDLTSPDDLRRFEREVRITVQLGRLHPNIMKVLDTRRFADGRPCIVMDFYEMGSTHDRLQATGPFSVADVVTIGRVICDALGFAHSRNVLHRDVKPQNILILPTSYVLADFGIARPMDAGHTSSLDRLSYRHASPEVLDGLPPEPGDDLWSLGSTLQTLLTGRAPFAADDPADDTALAYLRRVRLAQRRSLPADAPAALRAMIDRAMNPDRTARYHTAEEMAADLHALDREVDAWAPGGSASSQGGDAVAGAVRAAAPPAISAAAPAPASSAPGPSAPGPSAPSPSAPSSSAPASSAPARPLAPLPVPTVPAPAPQGGSEPVDAGDGGAGDGGAIDPTDEDALWAPRPVLAPAEAPSTSRTGSGTGPAARWPALPEGASSSPEPAGSAFRPRPTIPPASADALAGIAPSVAGSVAGSSPGSVAGSLAGSFATPDGPGFGAPGDDAAPTGLHPGARRGSSPGARGAGAAGARAAGARAGSAGTDASAAVGDDIGDGGYREGGDGEGGDGDDNGGDSRRSGAGTPPRVRARIVIVAGAMLVISAVVAYLISRPSPPPAVIPPPTSGTVTASASGSAGAQLGSAAGSGIGSAAGSLASGAGVPVAGGDLTIDDPDLRPTLLTVKITGNSITVTFTASGSAISHVTLVDVTHHNIAADTGPTPVLGMADASTGVVSGTLPAQDDADPVVRVVLVGASADFSRRGLSDVRSAHR